MSDVRNEYDFFLFVAGNWALEDLVHRLFSSPVVLVTSIFSLSNLRVRIFDRSPEDKHLKKEHKTGFRGQIKMI